MNAFAHQTLNERIAQRFGTAASHYDEQQMFSRYRSVYQTCLTKSGELTVNASCPRGKH